MALSIPVRHEFNIGNNTITLESNLPLDLELYPSGEKIARHGGVVESTSRVLRTAEGVSLVVKLMENFLRLAAETGLPDLRAAANRFADGAAVIFTFPRVPFLWFEVKKSVGEIRASCGRLSRPLQRKLDRGFGHFFEAISVTAKAITTGLSLANQNTRLLNPLNPFLSAVSFAGSALSVKMDVENVEATNRMIKRAEGEPISEECKTVLHQTKKRNLLALAKNVISAVACLAGLILIATGYGILPFIASLPLGLCGTIFALWGKVYEEGMRWKPIDLFGDKHVKQISLAPV